MEADDGRRTPLDDLDHLARSPHRSQVMLRFSKDDWTRSELHDETDISQPTLGRILGSFQDRHWLERHGATYSLTLRGQLIATQFADLLDVFETVQELPAIANFDPLLELGFETDWLARVNVTTSADPADSYAHIRHARKSVKSVKHIRELSPGPMPGMAEVIAERLHSGELTIETVFPKGAFTAFIDDLDNRSLVTEMLKTGNFQLHLYGDEIPCYIARQGEKAVFDIDSVEGASIAILTTEQPAVLEWVETIIDEFQNRAEQVRASDLAD